MATKTKAQVQEPEQVAAPIAASTYPVAELADNFKAFKTYREIVVVALRLAGKKEYTFEEAEKIIKEFKNKAVK